MNDLLLTCDWGRSEVFSHNLPASGATFKAQQETFLKLPRATDIDALTDPDPRVQSAAVVGLGRIFRHALSRQWVVTDQSGQRPVRELVPSVAEAVLPLTEHTSEGGNIDGENKTIDAWRRPGLHGIRGAGKR